MKELITWKEEGIQDLFTFYKGKVIRLNTYFGNSNNVYYNRAKNILFVIILEVQKFIVATEL